MLVICRVQFEEKLGYLRSLRGFRNLEIRSRSVRVVDGMMCRQMNMRRDKPLRWLSHLKEQWASATPDHDQA